MKKSIIIIWIIATIKIMAFGEAHVLSGEANNEYKLGHFKKAQSIYHKIGTKEAKYNEANCCYRLKQYQAAIKIYQDLVRSIDRLNQKGLLFRVYYNLGNTHFTLSEFYQTQNDPKAQIDNLFAAKESYEEAIFIKKDEDTLLNLKLVRDKLKLRDIKK